MNSHLCWSLHGDNEGCVKTHCSLEFFFSDLPLSLLLFTAAHPTLQATSDLRDRHTLLWRRVHCTDHYCHATWPMWVPQSFLTACLHEAQLFCLFEKRSNIRGATLWKITPNSDGDQFLIFVLFILHMYSGLSKKKKCRMVIYCFLRGGHCTQKWRGKGAGFIWLEKSQHTSTESVVLTGRSSYDNLINPDIWIRSEMFFFFS